MDHNNLASILEAESGSSPQAPKTTGRKWGPEQYLRRRISPIEKVNVNARVLPETRAKLERMATAGRVTMSEIVELAIGALDE